MISYGLDIHGLDELEQAILDFILFLFAEAGLCLYEDCILWYVIFELVLGFLVVVVLQAGRILLQGFIEEMFVVLIWYVHCITI